MLQFIVNYGIAILILRVALGTIMAAHGFPKLFKDRNGTIDFFKKLAFPIPVFLATLVGIVEFFGGLSLILGFFTQIAAFLIFINMAVALGVNVIKFKKQLIGGYELDLILLLVSLSIMLLGPGSYSIDWFLFT